MQCCVATGGIEPGRHPAAGLAGAAQYQRRAIAAGFRAIEICMRSAGLVVR